MKISIARLKEIIMEEVASAAEKEFLDKELDPPGVAPSRKRKAPADPRDLEEEIEIVDDE